MTKNKTSRDSNAVNGINELIPMTRRHFDLPRKTMMRDSRIVQKFIYSWDVEKDQDKLLALFHRHKDKLSDQRYWEALRTVWIICGNMDNLPLFKSMFLAKKKHRYCFSTPEEAAELRSLGRIFEVYRAFNAGHEYGISWSYNHDYVRWYKDRFKKEKIIERIVTREEIFALINRNGESEILIN